MRPFFKAIVILVVAAAVAAPAGYYAFIVNQHSDVTLPQLVPGNSTMVLSASINGTSFYAYNSSNSAGIVLGVSMSGFSSELSTAQNSTNSTQNKIEPVLYSTYRGYNIYRLSNVSLVGLLPSGLNTSLPNNGSLGNNLSLNLTDYLGNNTLYLADLPGIVSAGNLTAVQYSLDAYLDGSSFQNFAESNFNSTANASLYIKTTTTPVKQVIANIYYLKSTFNIQMSNQSNADLLTKGLSSVNTLANGFTVGYLLRSDNWVNGTITVGTGNYYLLQDFVTNLPSGNYTQLFSGLIP